MGRHTVPGSGQPTPDQGFWVRGAVAAVALLLVATYFLFRGDDDPVTTARPTTTPTPPTSSAATDTPPSETTTSAGPSSPSAKKAKRPPTLSFRLQRDSFITVRVPGGRTLVSRLFEKGEKRSFDQKLLEVVNGRPSAVRFRVNGNLRKPGPAIRPETFVVRRL